MPLHPFHWGPPGLLAPLTRNRLDLFSLLIGATLSDIDVVFIILTSGLVGHGFLHTFYGALVVALMVTVLALTPIRQRLQNIPLYGKAVDTRERPITMYFASGLLGAWTHIITDAVLYEELNPYFSSPMNRLYREGVSGALYLALGLALVLLAAWFFNNYIPQERDARVKPRPKPDILEEITMRRIGALLVVFLLFITFVVESNAPSPVGQMNMSGLEITEHSGNSLLLEGKAPRLAGVMGDELEVNIVWSGGSVWVPVYTTSSEHFFRAALKPVEDGDLLAVYMHLQGDSNRPRDDRTFIDTTSMRVPEKS